MTKHIIQRMQDQAASFMALRHYAFNTGWATNDKHILGTFENRFQEMYAVQIQGNGNFTVYQVLHHHKLMPDGTVISQ